MGELIVLLFIGAAIGGVVGAAIGSYKGRQTGGFFLGLFFGVIGWIVIGVMDPSPEERQRRNRELADAITGSLEAVTDPAHDANVSSAFQAMRAAAAVDAERATLTAAVSRLSLSGKIVRSTSGWMFASGPACLAVVHDGMLQLIKRDMSWTVERLQPPPLYTEDTNGRVVELTVGGIVLTNLRPAEQADLLVKRIGVRSAVVTPPPSAALPRLAAPDPSALAAQPADGPADPYNPPAGSPSPPDTTVSALRQLETLRAENLISDEEFTQKRAEILGRL